MFRPYGILAWVVPLGLAATSSGCGSPGPQEKQKPVESKLLEKPAGQGEHTGHEGHRGRDEQTAPDKYLAKLKDE